MSKILEIFGRAVNINTSDIIWHWLNMSIKKETFDEDTDHMLEILDLTCNLKFHLADENIDSYLLDFPASQYALMAQAAVALKRNRIPDAVEILKKVYNLYPSNTMALYTLGYCCEQSGEIKNAMKYYQDSLKFKSYLQLPHQRMAAIYLNCGRIENAIEHYKELTREYPDNTAFQVLLGCLYQANSQNTMAIESFQKAITMHPDNFQMTGQLDDVEDLIAQNELEAAVSSIQKKYHQFGEIPELHIKLSEIFQKRGELQNAVNALKHAINLQPNNMQATIKLATLYLQNGYYSLSAEYFNKALELNDEIVDAYIGLAKAQIQSNNVKEAKETLSLACAIQQNSNLLYGECSSIQYGISNSWNDIKKTVPIENMIKFHHERIKNNQENSDGYYKLGLILKAAGDIKSAAKQFEQAIKINPYHFRAKAKLIISIYEDNNFSEAVNLLKKNVQIDRDIMTVHYKTALLFCNQNKFENAINRLQNQIQQNFSTLSSINNISVVLENLGVIDRATANYTALERTYI